VTPAAPDAGNGPHGPPVGENEELCRCIAYPNWWSEPEQRITSAAFKFPCFSVDVASLAGSPDATLSRFRPGTGLVAFSCRVAMELGCDVRLEPDSICPGNLAHAHVYMTVQNRKAVARKLADACNVLRRPRFDTPLPPA
jgi:hypothetical protein